MNKSKVILQIHFHKTILQWQKLELNQKKTNSFLTFQS